MSEFKLGCTIGYIGPKKVEFPPLMNNVISVGKSRLKILMEKAEEQGKVLTIAVEEDKKPEKVVVKKEEDLGVELG